jgi:hypothetical protein
LQTGGEIAGGLLLEPFGVMAVLLAVLLETMQHAAIDMANHGIEEITIGDGRSGLHGAGLLAKATRRRAPRLAKRGEGDHPARRVVLSSPRFN